MRRLVIAIIATCPFAASAEVLDKQPSASFLLFAAASVSLIAYTVARHTKGWLVLLGLVPILVFIPALSEQLDPIMRSALFAEEGMKYIFCVWLGPASAVIAYAVGLHRQSRPSGKLIAPALFFIAASMLGGWALSNLSELSAIGACLVVAGAVLFNGIFAAIGRYQRAGG